MLDHESRGCGARLGPSPTLKYFSDGRHTDCAQVVVVADGDETLLNSPPSTEAVLPFLTPGRAECTNETDRLGLQARRASLYSSHRRGIHRDCDLGQFRNECRIC